MRDVMEEYGETLLALGAMTAMLAWFCTAEGSVFREGWTSFLFGFF